MAISFVGQSSTSVASGTTIPVNKPSGTQSGDFALVILCAQGAGRSFSLSGWTSASTGTTSVDSLAVLTRVFDGTEGSSFTFNCAGGAAVLTAILVVYRGTSGIDGTQIVYTSGTTTSGDAAALTGVTASAGDTVLTFNCEGGGVATLTAPTGFTLESTNTVNAEMGAADKANVSAGATGTVTWGGGGASTRYGGWVIALAPNAGGGTNAITFVASATGAINGNISLTVPSSAAAGQVAIAVVVSNNGGTVSGPATWTHIAGASGADSGADERQDWYYKVLNATDPGTSYTWTNTDGGAQFFAGVINVYSGVNINNPIDTSGFNTGTANTSLTAPSLTLSGPNEMVLIAFGFDDTSTPNYTLSTTPSGSTVRGSVPYAQNVNFGLWTGEKLFTGTGATGTFSATMAISQNWSGAAIALIPGIATEATKSVRTRSRIPKLRRTSQLHQHPELSIPPVAQLVVTVPRKIRLNTSLRTPKNLRLHPETTVPIIRIPSADHVMINRFKIRKLRPNPNLRIEAPKRYQLTAATEDAQHGVYGG